MPRKLDPAQQVPAEKTPWGPPWAQEILILRFDALLEQLGVKGVHERRRMTAHALMAAGYAQKCWWYNCWSVKVGGWQGYWYDKATTELIDGDKVHLANEAWRAYDSWAAALADYPIDTMKRYERSRALLHDPNSKDEDFFAQMGDDGYYTAPKFEEVDGVAPAVPGFMARANKYTEVMSKASDDDKRKAREWAMEELARPAEGEKKSFEMKDALLVLGLIGLVVAAVLFLKE